MTPDPPDDLPDWTPDLEDVGALLRARTRSDETGGELGTFDDSTRPTGDEVEEFISLAAIEVQLRLPTDMPDKLQAFARKLAALRAAMSVELSYDPDRTGDDTAYSRFQQLFEQGMAALSQANADQTAPPTAFGSIRMRSVATTDYTGEIDPLLDYYDLP